MNIGAVMQCCTEPEIYKFQALFNLNLVHF